MILFVAFRLDNNLTVIVIISGLIILLLYGIYRTFSKQPKKTVAESTPSIVEKQVQTKPEPTAGVKEPPVAEPIQKPEESIQKQPEPETFASDTSQPASIAEVIKPQPMEPVQKEPEPENIVSDTSHPASVTEVIVSPTEQLPSVPTRKSEALSEPAEKQPTVAQSSRRKKKPAIAERSLNVQKIEGIGPENAKKLREAGIKTTGELLEAGHTKSGRVQLAENTGVSQKLILEWVNLADLFRISGIGEEYSDLLEEAGVDTVVELARRNPENLLTRLIEVNAEKKLVKRVPTLVKVEDWIKQAKDLPRKVEY